MHSPESSVQQPQTPEANKQEIMELPPHVDVSKLMEEKNAFFVHTIQMINAFNLKENNEVIDTNKLSTADKLDILYAVNPTLSTSTLRPHTQDGMFHKAFGVILSQGEVEHANHMDSGSKLLSGGVRSVSGAKMDTKEHVDAAIDRRHGGVGTSHNELVVKNPEIAGGFMRIGSLINKISHEEEEHVYYDGQSVKTKVGILNLSNKKNWRGESIEDYDVPFNMLLEMSKRGKVFLMNDDNQMLIVRNIDEANRRVEFVDNPIEPKDFAYYYGKDKVNKYAKKEMRERLEQSLAEKGMSLG